MNISQLLEAAQISYHVLQSGECDLQVKDIIYDSRKSAPQTLFICLVGALSDGHDYAKNAYERGCRCFLVQNALSLPADAHIIQTGDTRTALGKLSAAFFGFPQRELTVIGVTGTKGKTTVACLLYAVMNRLELPCGVIGTSGISYQEKHFPTANTTPESYELMRTFREMLDHGIRYVVMEVSSQALFCHRVDEILFDTAIFTNLSRDHIGEREHPTFEHYRASKKLLFTKCKCGIFNADDPQSTYMQKDIGCEKITYGINHPADWEAKEMTPLYDQNNIGMHFICHNQAFSLKLPGEFNTENALAVIAAAERYADNLERISVALSGAQVKGRFQIVDALPNVTLIIDYAHNYISLKSLLQTVRGYHPKRIVCVFGSVGGRTKERRKELGEIAAEYADFAIITSDNPDFEAPDEIVNEIASYFPEDACPYKKIVDRTEAIHYALDHAKAGDVILFCGKGHEDYQIVRGTKEPFSEEKIIKQYTAQHKPATQTIVTEKGREL